MAKILIIDDDVALVESFAEILNQKGHTSVWAYSGDEGVIKARMEKPDLILLDVMMTSENEGFEVAQKLKSDPETKDIAVILVTGIRKAKNLPFGFEPDADWLPVKAVLEKPVPPEVLLMHVSKALQK
jgi:two-component system alkaline phosphatase synthesis response regulator PhoP